MGKAMEAEENSIPIFVTTNVDTRLVISSSPSDTVATLRGKIRNGHLFCFPHFRDIEIAALMVKHKSLVYHLPDSIFVETVFHGSNGTRYLLAEVSGSDLCNQQEYKILSGKDGNLGILTKTNGEFRRHLDEESDGTSLDVHNGKSKNKKKHKLVTDNNNEEYTDLVVAIEGKIATNDEFGKDPTSPSSEDKIADPKDGNTRKKRRKKLHDLNGDLAECILLPCKEKSKRDQVTEEIENIAHCSSERILKNIEMDKNSPVGHLTVSEKVSTLDSLNMEVENIWCEQQNLHGNTHTNAGNGHVTSKELGTARKHETSKELSTARKHETSSKIFNEESSLNGTEKESYGLQGKSDDAMEFDTEKKIKSKRKRSSKTVLDDDQGISFNDVNGLCQITKHGHLQEYKNGKTEENSAKECDIEKKSKRKIKMASKHGLGNSDHNLSSKYVEGEPQMTKHTDFLEYKCCKPEETCNTSVVSARNAHGRDAVTGSAKSLDIATGTEIHQQFNVGRKLKEKRLRIDVSTVDGQEKVTTELVQKNDANSGIHEGVETERMTEERGRDISSENGQIIHPNMQHSKYNAIRDLEHVPETLGTTPMANDQNFNDKEIKSSKKSSSKIRQERTFNIEKRAIEEVVAKCPVALNVSDKNGQTNNVMSGSVKYLDATNNTENHQPCIITRKKKTKHSRNDMTWVDAPEGITTEKVPKSDITVNCSKGQRDLEHITETIQTTSVVNNEDYNAEEVKSSKNSLSKINQDRTIKVVKRGMDEVVAKGSHSEQNARDLEHLPETLGTPPMANDQNCNDKEIKSSKNGSSKICQEKKTFNIDKRGIDEVVSKCPGAPIMSDKNGQTNNVMSGPVKYLDVSNNTENHQLCNITRKRKMKHLRNDMTWVDAQERITTEKVPKDDIIVNSSKSERHLSILDAGNENRRDTPGENGRVKHLNRHHSKNNASRDLEHITGTIRTTSVVNNEDYNAEEVKSSKNSPSKMNPDRTTKVVERGMDEMVAKGSNSEQNARDEEKKQKNIRLACETSPLFRNKAADSGLKSKSYVVPEGSDTNQSLKDQHANNAVVKKQHSVDQKLVQRRKGSADVDCKVKKTTISQFDTSDTNHSLRPNEDTGKDCDQKSAQKDKLYTSGLSYVKKSPKENQGDAHFTEKVQHENKKVASQKNIVKGGGHNLKKTESSSTAGTTQSSEKNEDIDWITNNDRSQGEDWLYDRKDNSVSCHSKKKTANDVYVDSQCAGEECGIDCNPVKDQLAGRTHDGIVMNRAIDKNTINPQIKSVKKTKVDNRSKKNHISLFRSSSDVSTDGDNEIDSYTGNSSSKRSSNDSSDSYDSDSGSRDKISKIQSIKPQTDWEPSTSGAQLSTAVGKKKDNGGTGSIHSKFVHLLAKKTGLGELFKIARAQQKPESQHFGGDFMADDSPTVDMVLETQESQLDPVLTASHNRELSSSPIRADEVKEDGKILNAEVPKANLALKLDAEAPKTNFVSKSHPDDSQKVLWKSNSPLPINNSVQLKKPRKASNR